MTVDAAVVPLLLSAEGVLRALSITDVELAELVVSGRLPEVRLRPGGPVRFRLDDVLLIANAATADGLVP